MKIAIGRFQVWLLVALIPVAIAILALSRAMGGSDRAPLRLKVDLSERQLYVIEDGETVQTYPVAVGLPSHPTPTGNFTTGRIEWNPGWTPPPREWAEDAEPAAPGDPNNPMQAVKIYFKEPWYFIHGTNDPESIGTAASHGCIRMTPSDATALANRIEEAGGNVPLEIVA